MKVVAFARRIPIAKPLPIASGIGRGSKDLQVPRISIARGFNSSSAPADSVVMTSLNSMKRPATRKKETAMLTTRFDREPRLTVLLGQQGTGMSQLLQNVLAQSSADGSSRYHAAHITVSDSPTESCIKAFQRGIAASAVGDRVWGGLASHLSEIENSKPLTLPIRLKLLQIILFPKSPAIIHSTALPHYSDWDRPYVMVVHDAHKLKGKESADSRVRCPKIPHSTTLQHLTFVSACGFSSCGREGCSKLPELCVSS